MIRVENTADTIFLSQFTYSGNNTEVLKFGVHVTGEQKTKYYIWGSPDAKRLGLNVGWMQTGVTLSKQNSYSQ